MTDLEFQKIKNKLRELKNNADYDNPAYCKRVVKFHENAMPQLLAEIERLNIEIQKLEYKYRHGIYT